MSASQVNAGALKVLDVMKELKGHTLSGLSNTDLSQRLKMSAPTVTRCLNTLVKAGMATQLETGRYALSIQMLRIAQAHATEMTAATDRINKLNQDVLMGRY